MKIDQFWKKWIECLAGEDRNTISNQIISLIWDSGIYRLLLECRKNAIAKDKSNPKINYSLYKFIDLNFFESQASAIRRLTDKSYKLHGERGVYSLIALINDIKENNDKLNRSNYFKLRNIPYDIDNLRKKQSDFLRDKYNQDQTAILIPDEYSPERSIETHNFFDKLSNVNCNNRNPDDLITNSVWDELEKKIEKCNDLNGYVDKFIAHASSTESRMINKYKQPRVTFNKLFNIHKLLCEVVDFLSIFISGSMLMFLPIEPPSFFEYWDIPLIDTLSVDKLKTAFEKYRKETENWRNEYSSIYESDLF